MIKKRAVLKEGGIIVIKALLYMFVSLSREKQLIVL